MYAGYEGPLNDEGQRHGVGTHKLPSGNVYKGMFVANKWHGRGEYTMTDGCVFRGTFRSGRYHGRNCEYTFSDGSQYRGDFKDSFATGFGRLSSSAGVYTGDFELGFFHGVGEMIYASGQVYYGQWQWGKQHGRGLLIFNMKESPSCTAHNREPELYYGEFENDSINGRGLEIDKFGEVFEGNWVNGVVHGPKCKNYICCFTLQDGEFEQGVIAKDYLQMLHFAKMLVYAFSRTVCCCDSRRGSRCLSDMLYPHLSRASFTWQASELFESLRAYEKDWAILGAKKFGEAGEDTEGTLTSETLCSTEADVPESQTSANDVNLTTAEGLPPIRMIDFDDFRQLKSFPRFPDQHKICTTLDEIDKSTSFFIFVSHCWISGWEGAQDWRGYPHVDTKDNAKFLLCLKACEITWRMLAPGMKKCYIWCDFGCINQDGDPAGELKQLSTIVQVSDCMLTPIVDVSWQRWRSRSGSSLLSEVHIGGASTGGLLNDYKAALWSEGPHSYLHRAWCRMEMLYAANVPLQEGNESRTANFKAGLKSAALCGRRPHLLYGTSEFENNDVPLILEPLQNSYFDDYHPNKGSITKESDRLKIDELMGCLTIIRAEEKYVGARDDQGRYSGQGKLTLLNGDVYQGGWLEGLTHGQGRQIYSNGDMYEGDWVRGVKSGTGRYDFANGRTYSGSWRADMWHGKGVYQMLDEKYSGDFCDMEMTGQGERTFKNGSVYSGDFLKGHRQGQGKLTMTDGTVYVGQWEDDCMEGQGKMMWTNRSTYVGSFHNDKREGRGIFISEWGKADNGDFVNNSFHGSGTRRYLCCPLAIGPWSEGYPGTICGWISVGFCAFPALSCMCIVCTCSFDNIWDSSVRYNQCCYRRELNGHIFPDWRSERALRAEKMERRGRKGSGI